MFKHILIPTDGSVLSNKAAKAAIALAKDEGAEVTAYYAQAPGLHTYYGDGLVIDKRTTQAVDASARKFAEQSLAEVSRYAQAKGVDFTALTDRTGDVHEGIIAAAKKRKCDVIFMASNARRGLTRLVMGSVTSKVLAHAKTPVLVYR